MGGGVGTISGYCFIPYWLGCIPIGIYADGHVWGSIMDAEGVVRRMGEDKMFFMLYPVCQVSGEDVDEVIERLSKKAKETGRNPLTEALLFRLDYQHKLIQGLSKDQKIDGIH